MFTDIRSDARLMSHDVALYDQLEGVEDRATLTIEGLEAIDGLPHVFESMARNVVGPRIERTIECSPIDMADMAKLREETERLEWATKMVAEYHGIAAELRDAKAAA